MEQLIQSLHLGMKMLGKDPKDVVAEQIIDYSFLGVYIVTTFLYVNVGYRTMKVKENRTYQNCLTLIFIGLTLFRKNTILNTVQWESGHSSISWHMRTRSWTIRASQEMSSGRSCSSSTSPSNVWSPPSLCNSSNGNKYPPDQSRVQTAMILNWQYKLQVEMNRRQHSERTESDHSINRMSLG